MRFFDNMRRRGQARLAETNDSGERVFEDPIWIKKDPQRVTAVFEFFSRPLPRTSTVAEIRIWGGSVRILIDYAEEGVENGIPILTITGIEFAD